MTDQIEMFSRQNDPMMRQFLRWDLRGTLYSSLLFVVVTIIAAFVTEDPMMLLILLMVVYFAGSHYIRRRRVADGTFGSDEADRNLLDAFFQSQGGKRVRGISLD